MAARHGEDVGVWIFPARGHGFPYGLGAVLRLYLVEQTRDIVSSRFRNNPQRPQPWPCWSGPGPAPGDHLLAGLGIPSVQVRRIAVDVRVPA
jgi:hypothetical protein